MSIHYHPISKRIIEGDRLRAGAVLRSTDVYDSTTGYWTKCPSPGVTVQEGNNTIWVRPDVEDDSVSVISSVVDVALSSAGDDSSSDDC